MGGLGFCFVRAHSYSVPLGFRIEGFLVAQCFWRAGSQELLMA